jgi:hypothetical protein
MATTRVAPESRRVILPDRPSLKEHFSAAIAHDYGHSAVQRAIVVCSYFLHGADAAIAFVNKNDPFIAH